RPRVRSISMHFFRRIFAVRHFFVWAVVARVIQFSRSQDGPCPVQPLSHRQAGTDNQRMRARRYTVLVADRSNGVLRRLTVNLRPAVAGFCGVMMVPILIGLGARWSATTGIDRLRNANSLLQVENASYRAATGELTTQIQSLEGVIDDLGSRASLDPAAAHAMQKLPAVVKSRAAGGASQANAALANILSASLALPEDTFGVLRDLLQGLENRLRYVRKDVERREALAAATPSIWPA